MNVFEDLIEELKEENLLETTVIEINKLENKEVQPNLTPAVTENKTQIPVVSSQNQTNQFVPFPTTIVEQESQVVDESSFVQSVTDTEYEQFEFPSESIALQNEILENESLESPQLVEEILRDTTSFADKVIEEEEALIAQEHLEKENSETLVENPVEESIEDEQPKFPEYELLAKNVIEDSEFYRRRANEEVTSLQIVEHIITAIEKEQMKIVPQSYDDLAVSMALHDFLQAGNDPLSNEHTQAEFKLMQETEKWYSALAQRDKNITVGDLRRYTENARPALSAQALISLARFYRNSPFSESVRSKFDMVITRLVSKENWDDTRILLFNREELITQLGELYSDWSSIPLYEANQEDSDVLIAVLKFEDFILEINNAESLDELVKNDFFNRVKEFKESTNEKFFAPLLVAASVECNIIVGNKYVQLVQLEKTKRNNAEIEEKYNFLLDQPVSDTVSKTLKLIEILKEKKEPVKPAVVEKPKEIKEELVAEKTSKSINAEIERRKKTPKFKINYLLIAVVFIGAMGLGSLYFWAEYMTPQMKPSPNVKKVSLENSSLKEYFKTARINRETFFAVTDTAWDKLSKEVKEDVLKKTIAEGKTKGYNKIHVLDTEGKTVAFASEKGVTIDPK